MGRGRYASCTQTGRLFSMRMACTGHLRAHRPQPMRLSSTRKCAVLRASFAERTHEGACFFPDRLGFRCFEVAGAAAANVLISGEHRADHGAQAGVQIVLEELVPDEETVFITDRAVALVILERADRIREVLSDKRSAERIFQGRIQMTWVSRLQRS